MSVLVDFLLKKILQWLVAESEGTWKLQKHEVQDYQFFDPWVNVLGRVLIYTKNQDDKVSINQNHVLKIWYLKHILR